ncbi:MAG: RNA-binding cell elongation regulator Jag/EloR [Aggregatilineales bacterium]
MSQSIEASGPDIESAVAEAVAQLGVRADQVQVEVLEEPVRRLLGLGTRPARVRVTVIGAVDTSAPASSLPSTSAKPVAEPKRPSTVEAKPKPIAEVPSKVDTAAAAPTITPPESKPQPAHTKAEARPHQSVAKPERSEIAPEPPIRRDAILGVRDDTMPGIHEADEASDTADAPSVPITDEQLDRDAQTAAEVLRKLMGFMSIDGSVTVRHADTDGREARHWLLEVQGDDLAALIGNKGETLAALQYLTRLIVSRQIGHHANLIIDVAGYKSHREEMLKRLAKRMAGQAVELKRMVTLEPMPPHERRIVHLTLRDHPEVTTESVGEGDKRKVTIIPRRKP